MTTNKKKTTKQTLIKPNTDVPLFVHYNNYNYGSSKQAISFSSSRLPKILYKSPKKKKKKKPFLQKEMREVEILDRTKFGSRIRDNCSNS